jgi:methylenetetrahydrofolate reductase (NADPH)
MAALAAADPAAIVDTLAPPVQRQQLTADAGVARRASALVAAASIEILPRDASAAAIDALRGVFRAGTQVFVNHPPGVTHHDVVAACVQLRCAGFDPVPHIAARQLASYTQAVDFLRRAAEEAEIDKVLLIGGDAHPPVGPFGDSLGLLASGVIERHGVRRVVFAGYPEGHPLIAGRALDTALQAKLALAGDAGLAVEIVTQFGFEAAPILGWIAALRRAGVSSLVRVGIAGPASVATLAKAAVRCGAGASLRSLAQDHTAAFARTQAEVAPDDLIRALVAGEAATAPIAGLHVYTFGGPRRTAEWVESHFRPHRL